MLTVREKLEQLGRSRIAQTALGAFLVVAGIVLGTGYQAATTVATDQAGEITQVCSEGGAAGRELAARGTCQDAQEVAADPVSGPAGEPGPAGPGGTQGATGSPGKPGAPGVGIPGTPGTAGIDGRPGVAGRDGQPGADSTVPGPRGEAGTPGADSTVPGPQGPRGEPGADSTIPGPRGPAGQDGRDGAPGPTCPDGFEQRTVLYADGQTGVGCVAS